MSALVTEETERVPAKSRDSTGLAQTRRTRRVFWVVSLVILVVWEGVARFGLVDPLFLSGPSRISVRFYEMFFVTGEIYAHLAISAYELGLGFALALIVGIFIGVLMAIFPVVKGVVEPYVIALSSIPGIALLPLLMIWLGIDLSMKVAVVFIGGVFSIIINTYTAAETVDPGLLEVGRIFRFSRRQIVWRIVVPWSIPYIVAGIRVAIGRMLVMVVVAEMFASMQGIGYLISRAGSTYQTADIFVGIVILAGVGMGLSSMLTVLESRIAPWRRVG